MSESSFKERFCRAIELNEANDDSVKNPFQSKYDARKILKEIREDLRKMREENESDVTLRAMEAWVDCLIGVNFINTEETSTGQEALNRVIQLCETYEKHPMFVSTLIVSNNELGVLWSNREEGIQRAYEHLTRAEQFYTEYKRDVDDTPMTGRELLTSEATDAERITSFEALHTNTLYYLAQAHRTLGNPDLSATYCMKTLHRQLGSKSFIRVDWVVNCACLSQYYITKNMFAEAKHCLACADFVLDETTEEEDNRLVEKRADVSRCWVKYCLCLLEESKAKLANSIGDMDTTRQQNADTSTTEGLKHESRFPLEVTLIEEKCPHDYCVNFNQAKKVFQFGKDRATESLKHFVLDGFVTDHIELNQDMSRLYQHVSFFEPNYDVRCKMYKRRLDMLIKIVGEINPQYYLAVTRQLQFEIGETYSDMMDMKVAILTSSGQPPNQHSVKKINLLCYSSIKYFGLFLDTLRLPGKKFPERFESDVERPGLIAHFYIARLYGKLIPVDSAEKLANLKLSHQFYTWIVTYTKINDDAALCVKQELDICREMSELLPQSMDRLM
ncbi:KIF-binding protein-like [Ciona intestinalis]